jgi:Pyruvate/2-oxoacid:ferredoxin oxidoreductase delta subunit
MIISNEAKSGKITFCSVACLLVESNTILLYCGMVCPGNKTEDFTAMFVINQQNCTRCGGCASVCPELAIIIHDHTSGISEKCSDCGICALFCPVSAIVPLEKRERSNGLEI